jgi:glucosamine--fructose-6-phosphate aminotransferase (isomerizing)
MGARPLMSLHKGETSNCMLMEAEMHEAPHVVARQPDLLASPLRELAARLRHTPPQVVVTCARGSSAHAANFGKYLIERHLGVPVASVAPSIMTIYRQGLGLKGQLFLTISQSGRSDDLVEAALSARAFGALTAAIVNDTRSPLASACDIVLPMAAGKELSVAATKTFVASVAILLNLTASWASERSIQAALDRLPERLGEAAQLDWSPALSALHAAKSLATLGRGPTLAIAQEASLKLKEVCNIQAEAFSGAEFQHGPITLVSDSYPVVIFMPTDEAASNLAGVAADISRKSSSVIVTGTRVGEAGELPVLARDHPDTDAVCLIQSFYRLAVRLAEDRGLNVDRPRHLRKITRTR